MSALMTGERQQSRHCQWPLTVDPLHPGAHEKAVIRQAGSSLPLFKLSGVGSNIWRIAQSATSPCVTEGNIHPARVTIQQQFRCYCKLLQYRRYWTNQCSHVDQLSATINPQTTALSMVKASCTALQECTGVVLASEGLYTSAVCGMVWSPHS